MFQMFWDFAVTSSEFEAITYLYLFQSFAGMLIDSKPFSWNYFVFTKP